MQNKENFIEGTVPKEKARGKRLVTVTCKNKEKTVRERDKREEQEFIYGINRFIAV
jgi:hypothetical protein